MWYYKKLTKKLFFKKYVFKVAIKTPLASLFRGNRPAAIKANLDLLEDKLNRSKGMRVQVGPHWSRTLASRDDVLVGAKILEHLEELKDYVVRVESDTLGIYFNDSDYLDIFTNIPGIVIEEISEPFDDTAKNYLLTHPGVIIRSEYSHKYKVTIKSLYHENENFKSWAAKYDKIKLMPSNHYKYGGHFYVADDKMLSLCRLYMSDKVVKVEELVATSEM